MLFLKNWLYQILAVITDNKKMNIRAFKIRFQSFLDSQVN